ncbi:SRPBCC domain-containing protein [Megasphaera hexanoica]|uniref:SRPBCC domain-containing protein n=1 Tax=Megasphaera hexanoica TaxID=1675036 RepID=A0ABW7DPG8_9FIRM|nr:SRPBCC domain-containing protein [Megasphaera hexanoica]AXB82738.1 polyketide cyclase [Megasphaera hexanoica]
MLHEIKWPHEYLPGYTDNFASNEVIVRNASAKEVFDTLIDAGLWESYYKNSADVEFDNTPGTILRENTRFRFKTFGFPIEAQIIEFEEPSDGRPGRLAWHGWAEGDADHRLDVVHAWLIEDLPENRVRILTQESQVGKPARELQEANPDPMNIGHQDWLKGLVATVQAQKQ